MTALLTHSSSSDLRIYDPYYCNGAVQKNLASLGFPNVYNRKEDCYRIWKVGLVESTSTMPATGSDVNYPPFDILVTNPPYSADHMEKLMLHLTSTNSKFGSRPWFLLMPNWVRVWIIY
jgi:hypothetical protein